MDKEIGGEALGSSTPMEIVTAAASTPLRSSARVSKKKLDSLNKQPQTVLEKSKDENEKGECVEKEEKGPVKKPTLWPMEEKDLFFEAVNEYGKDFAAIQRFFVLKNKNKDCPVRSKEQIRRFFYRTWAKISPKLHFPSYIPKQAQELYALINYGELRKKCKGWTKKDTLRLNELIIRGFTQIRGKNKTMIIRTPRCRVLRRLCRVDDNQEVETKLPSSVRVELMPSDNHTWSYVQGLAQNPRVIAHVPLQCRLSSLLQFLHKRWLPRHEKYKMKLMEGYDGDAGIVEPKGMVVLRAKPNAEVHPAQVSVSHCNTHTKICLTSYEEVLGKKGESLEILNKLYAELGTKVKKQKSESIVEKKTDVEEGLKKEEIEEVQMDVPEIQALNDELDCTSANEHNFLEVKEDCNTEDEEPKEVLESTTSIPPSAPAAEELVAKVKEGWTLENCSMLTVGDIYLMVGSEYKLQLDYHFSAAAEAIQTEPRIGQLSHALARLVRLASMTRSQCPCRHQSTDSKRPRKENVHEENALQLNTSDTPFRRPMAQTGSKRIVQGTGRHDTESVRAQMDKLTPKFGNRRNRGYSAKTVVVQRTLPIQPVVSNGSQVTLTVVPQRVPVTSETDGSIPPSGTVAEPEPPPSPTPSISTILNESLQAFAAGGDLSSSSTIITTPAQEREEWLSEVAECSLSSLLNHLETPAPTKSQDSFDPSPPDVETHFQYLMTEASLDFTAKFAALAAEVTSESNQ